MKSRVFLFLVVVLINGYLQAAEKPGSVQAPGRDATEGLTVGLTVTKTTDEAGSCDPGNCSLREAIMAANSSQSAVITFDHSVFSTPQTIFLASALPNFNVDINIRGPGANLLTIRRDSETQFRIFTIPGPQTIYLSGLTLRNGKANMGGAVWSNAAQLWLTGMDISDNQATYAGGGIALTGRSTCPAK